MERKTIIISVIVLLVVLGGTIGYLVWHQKHNKKTASTAVQKSTPTPTTQGTGTVDPRGIPNPTTTPPHAMPAPSPSKVATAPANHLAYVGGGVELTYPKTWKTCAGSVTNGSAATAKGMVLLTSTDQTCSTSTSPEYGVTLTEEVSIEKSYPTLAAFRTAVAQAKASSDRGFRLSGYSSPLFMVNDSQDTVFNNIAVTQVGETVPGSTVSRLGVYFIVNGKLLKLTYFTFNGQGRRSEAYDIIASLKLASGSGSAATNAGTRTVQPTPSYAYPSPYPTPYATPAQNYPYPY